MAPGTYDTIALPPAVSAPPRFVSILAARQNDTRPSGTYHTILQPRMNLQLTMIHAHV
jgi:hypothetical protein